MKNRYDDVKDICKVEKETVEIKGTLIALDIKAKKFKLQLEDGSIKSGVLTNEFLDNGSFEIPKEYIATIDIEKLINHDKFSYKEKYCLKKLTV